MVQNCGPAESQLGVHVFETAAELRPRIVQTGRSLCLDEAVLVQGRGGVSLMVDPGSCLTSVPEQLRVLPRVNSWNYLKG